MIEKMQARAPRRDERDRDRKADEQHHARLSGTDLTDRAGQERPATPEIHDRAEDRRDPPDPLGIGQVVADEMSEHLVEPHHRDREGEHDPEQPPELSHVIPMAMVTAMAGMGLMIVMAGMPRVSVVPGMGVVSAVMIVPIVTVTSFTTSPMVVLRRVAVAMPVIVVVVCRHREWFPSPSFMSESFEAIPIRGMGQPLFLLFSPRLRGKMRRIDLRNHRKLMVVDGQVAVMGSSNMDMRSFGLDYEISLLAYGGDIVDQVHDVIAEYMALSSVLDAEAWPKRSALRRYTESVMRLTSALQ